MTDQTSPATTLVERCVAALTTAATDPDGFLALFTPDAVVEDDGHRHEGHDAIRAWRASVPSVVHEVVEVRGERAVVAVSGDFPGSPVTLTFHATVDAGRIRALRIAP